MIPEISDQQACAANGAFTEEIRPASENVLPTVAIFAEPLPAPSMRFVRSQGDALTRFEALYVGAKRIPGGLALPAGRVVTIRRNGRSLTRFKEIPFKVFGKAPLFFRRVREFHPVLVHAHFGPAARSAVPLARWLRVPLIATFHGSDVTTEEKTTYLDWRYSLDRARLRDGGQFFLAVSQFIRRKLLHQGFPEDRLLVHYIGVDRKFYSEDPRIPRENIVLFAARLEEVKGCAILIRAMEMLQSEFPETELVILGDGSQKKELQQQASRNLRRCCFLGLQPPEAVRHWMNRARIFCLPGVRAKCGDEEGFGLAVVEAQAMGLPVIASRAGGLPEAIEHGRTGFLAEPGSAEQLVLQLRKLLIDQRLWTKFSLAGPAHVRKKFDLQTQTSALERIYTEVLDRYHQKEETSARSWNETRRNAASTAEKARQIESTDPSIPEDRSAREILTRR
jgi:colanic acid/amylovoran biosynthesis glycosyltransferase